MQIDTAFFERLGLIDFALVGGFVLVALCCLMVCVASTDPAEIKSAEKVGAFSTLLAVIALCPLALFALANVVGWLVHG